MEVRDSYTSKRSNPIKRLVVLSSLGETFSRPFQFLEPNDPGVNILLCIAGLPSIFRKIYVWYLHYIRRDPMAAGLVSGLSRKTVAEHFALVTKREDYRARFHKEWNKEGFDFLLTVPNAMPAFPLGGMGNSIGSVGYSFLFNLVSTRCSTRPYYFLFKSHGRPRSLITALP